MAKKPKKTSTADQQARKEKTDLIIFQVAEKMINLLSESAGKEWQKPWHSSGFSAPMNPITGHQFSGFNRFKLMFEMLDRGTDDPRFLTFNQMVAFNDENQTECKIRTGEKATYVLRPSIVKLKPKPGEDDLEGKEKSIVFFNHYAVFHASQIDGFPEMGSPDKVEWSNDNFIERLMTENNIDLRHGGDRAFFHHGQDYIRMPEKTKFDSSENYYATLLHEFYHWTGFKSRENRVFGKSRDSVEYATEELRAESFSCLAGMMLDLPINLGNHAAYLDAWRARLGDKSGVKEVIKCMNEAGKILDAVMAFRDDQAPPLEWWGGADEALEPIL